MRGRTPDDSRLLELLDPVAEAAGYEIVRLRLIGGGARRLQILAEDAQGAMTIDDCTRLSRAFSAVLDDADPIGSEYLLEVSTPGVERPLTRLKDFEAWRGCQARLELDRLLDARKRFKGVLGGVDGDEVIITVDGEAVPARIPFSAIGEARLVLTDDLLRRGAEQRQSRLSNADPTTLN